jgi:antitoxin component YwqK of YwqJK toxin-antitoxin module
MKYIILCSLVIFFGCKKEVSQKRYYPNGKLNYSLREKADTTKITFFDKNEKAVMKLNFYKDHFIGAIVYNKNPNLPFKDSTIIDSVRGPYFFGTEYIIFEKGPKLMGSYRYKRNSDFRKALESQQPFGVHNTFDMNGGVIEKTEYIIVNDTVYNTKIAL